MSDEENIPVFTDSFRSFPHQELVSKVPLLRRSVEKQNDYDDDDIVHRRPEIPSLEKAEQYRVSQLNLMGPYNAGEPPQYYPLNSSTKALGKLGTDVAIYFEMLFWASIRALLFGVLSIPLMIENYRNTANDDIGLLYRLGYSNPNGLSDMATETSSISAVLVIIALVMLMLLERYRYQKLRLSLEETNIGIQHYSIVLYNISQSMRDPESISAFFTNLQEKVVSVLLIPRKLNRLVNLYAKQDRLENEIERMKLGGQTNNSEIDAVVNTLHKVERDIDLNEFYPKMSGAAVVTFEQESSTIRTLKTLNASCFPCALYCICACCTKKRFYGRRVYAISAAHPDDMIYHHLKYRMFSHFWRGCVLYLGGIIFVLPFVSVAVSISMKSASSDNVTDYVAHLPMNMAFAAIVVLCKKIIALVVRWAVRFLKLHTKSQQETWLARLHFTTELEFLLMTVLFMAYDRVWSGDWASSLIAIQSKLFSIWLGILVSSLMSPISPIYRIRMFIKSKLAVTQKDLNEAVDPPEFSPGAKAGELFALQFLTFSYGMWFPIGYFILALVFQVRYWCYKYECLRINKRAVPYKSFIAQMITFQHTLMVTAFVTDAGKFITPSYEVIFSYVAWVAVSLCFGFSLYEFFLPFFKVPIVDHTHGKPFSQQQDLGQYKLPAQRGKKQPTAEPNV